MRKFVLRFLVLSVMVIAAAAVLPAVPVTCQSLIVGTGSTTLQALMDAGACQSQDKIFSNFAYNGSVAASAVNATIVLQTGTSDIHGWSFNPETAWTVGFTLSYDITVADAPSFAMVLSKDQMNSGGVPNGITINDTQTGVGVLALTGSIGGETVFSSAYNLQTIHTSSVATIPQGRNLLSYEQDWFEGTVPEPVTFVLIGSGLLGIGLLRRRVGKS